MTAGPKIGGRPARLLTLFGAVLITFGIATASFFQTTLAAQRASAPAAQPLSPPVVNPSNDQTAMRPAHVPTEEDTAALLDGFMGASLDRIGVASATVSIVAEGRPVQSGAMPFPSGVQGLAGTTLLTAVLVGKATVATWSGRGQVWHAIVRTGLALNRALVGYVAIGFNVLAPSIVF